MDFDRFRGLIEQWGESPSPDPKKTRKSQLVRTVATPVVTGTDFALSSSCAGASPESGLKFRYGLTGGIHDFPKIATAGVRSTPVWLFYDSGNRERHVAGFF